MCEKVRAGQRAGEWLGESVCVCEKLSVRVRVQEGGGQR